jgi:hypothetical protein
LGDRRRSVVEVELLQHLVNLQLLEVPEALALASRPRLDKQHLLGNLRNRLRLEHQAHSERRSQLSDSYRSRLPLPPLHNLKET